jgi:uncharacterized protein (TIGR02186 family)
MKRGRRFVVWLLAAGLAGCGLTAHGAQPLVADLSRHLIAITTGFTGTEVVLFGSTEGEGDVVVVVRGPTDDVVVRRKEQVAGIWLNAAAMTFENVPGFYAFASSRPLADIAAEPVLKQHGIGVENMTLDPTEGAGRRRTPAFREALIRNKQQAGLYPTAPAKIVFIGERLFRTDLQFPANVPTGAYLVQTFLFRGGQVATVAATPLVVSKVGFSAYIFALAQERSVGYGFGAVLGAVMLGFLANAAFRRA